jgi:predicted deacetylase
MPTSLELIVSIHDVMPNTLGRVDRLLDRVDQADLSPATLLVIPGLDWRDSEIDHLRHYVDMGHELAGHGWVHRVDRVRGVWHSAHALLLSRNVAEHLALDPEGIRRLIADCFNWFARHDLPEPSTYVPPAWAMGSLPRRDMRDLGFRYFETLGGIYDSHTETFKVLPVIGFEADTWAREIALRLSNKLNVLLARGRGEARLAIHPADPELRLGNDLARWLETEGGESAQHKARRTTNAH